MAVCKIDKIEPIIIEVLSILCLFMACILLIIGGIFYTNDRYKVLNYANTMCTVQNSSWKAVIYVQMYTIILHYVPSWHLSFNGHNGSAEGNVQYNTYQEALIEAQKYRVNSFYSCWYDTKKLTLAQWDKPNTRLGSILISFGTISLFLSIVFIFVTQLLIRRNERKIAENNIPHVHVTFLK